MTNVRTHVRIVIRRKPACPKEPMQEPYQNIWVYCLACSFATFWRSERAFQKLAFRNAHSDRSLFPITYMVYQIHPSWHFSKASRLVWFLAYYPTIQRWPNPPSIRDIGSHFNSALSRHLSDGFRWDFFLTNEVVSEVLFMEKKGLRAPTDSNGGWGHWEIAYKHLCDLANPFSGGQKKDRQGSDGLKAIINPLDFRIPERAFCVLRFGSAKF